MSNLDTYSTRRLEALTDGVFAIAMTLLVLDLKVEDLGAAATNDQLWQALLSMQDSLTSFIISFLLLGSMWAVHMRQFEFIKRADRHLTMINTLRLLTVVLIPLTTSIAGNYSDLVLGRVLFPINFFALALVSYWQWDYAVSKSSKFAEGLSLDDKAYLAARNKAILIISFAVVFLAAAIGEPAFLLFLLTPFLNRSRLQRQS